MHPHETPGSRAPFPLAVGPLVVDHGFSWGDTCDNLGPLPVTDARLDGSIRLLTIGLHDGYMGLAALTDNGIGWHREHIVPGRSDNVHIGCHLRAQKPLVLRYDFDLDLERDHIGDIYAADGDTLHPSCEMLPWKSIHRYLGLLVYGHLAMSASSTEARLKMRDKSDTVRAVVPPPTLDMPEEMI